MRVLFSSTSGHGHVFPMIPLALAFREAGHEVLWATAAHAMSLVNAAGIDAVASGATAATEAASRHEVRSQAEGVAPCERSAFVFPRMFGEALTPPMIADLLGIARDWGPDLLVHENGELASPLVGAVCGVPSVTHAFGGAIPAGILAEAGERLAGLWAQHDIEIRPYAGCFEAVYLDICPPSVQSVPVDHVPERQLLRPVADIGGASAAEPPTDDSEPLVFVTLGTVQERPDVLRDVVAALAPLPVRVLVAVGPRMDPAVLGDQPANVRVERWVDQPEVLRRCAVVVSHGGSGTFLGALAQGLPQLCLPQAADQFRNAEGGSRAGAALTLMPDQATPASVRAAVHRLLTDVELRRGAQRVAAEIAAMPAPAVVVDALVERYGN